MKNKIRPKQQYFGGNAVKTGRLLAERNGGSVTQTIICVTWSVSIHVILPLTCSFLWYLKMLTAFVASKNVCKQKGIRIIK